MDNLIAESNDTMINSLNFGLPETSQYITDRRFVNYFPSGSNVYNPNAGNKNIRFYISSETDYVDLSSIKLFATIENTNGDRAKFLCPLSGLHGFFNRFRLTVGVQLVGDIAEYNRHCELYDCFKSKNVRDMDDIESGEYPRWDGDYHDYANGLENLVAVNAAGDGVDVFPTDDRNEFGRIDKRYARHSLTGIAGWWKIAIIS